MNVCGCLFIVPFEFNFSLSGILELQVTAYARGIAMYCYSNLQIVLRFSPLKHFYLNQGTHPPPPSPKLKTFSTQQISELKISSTQSIPPGPSEPLHRLFPSTKDTSVKLLKHTEPYNHITWINMGGEHDSSSQLLSGYEYGMDRNER